MTLANNHQSASKYPTFTILDIAPLSEMASALALPVAVAIDFAVQEHVVLKFFVFKPALALLAAATPNFLAHPASSAGSRRRI